MQRTARQMLQIATSRGRSALFDDAIAHIEGQAKQGALTTRFEIAGASPRVEVQRLIRALEQQGYMISRVRSNSIDIGWSRESIAYAEGREERERREHAEFVHDMKWGAAACLLVPPFAIGISYLITG